ncbi:MAG: TIGR00296 family protein [Methanomassiliicoccaceae archaeon]|jgi:uncharacterized protein (TIGR00296 family)|nr:TIGR00296 family protein [Methanomassiliicoccaceae archaeon]
MDADDGTIAVRLARKIIVEEATLTRSNREPELTPPFDEPTGVFVTIHTYPQLALRGCIGFTEAAYPLRDAIEYAARSACHDPRFLDLEADEINDIVVEVTILMPPKAIPVKDKADLPKAIRIGRDGLMLEYRGRRSVFLPQVPGDWGWDAVEYLENLCQKAGLAKDMWKDKECIIFAFEGIIYRETSPDGDVEEVKEC